MSSFVGALEDAIAAVQRDPKTVGKTQLFTLRLPKGFHMALKRRAQRDGRSMNQIIVDLVEDYLIG